MTEKRTEFGLELEESLREVLAWTRGDVALETVNVDPMPPARVKAIRMKAASSPRKFALRYGIPASTVSNWEQGRRRMDPAATLLLKIIEQDPDLVERVARSA